MNKSSCQRSAVKRCLVVLLVSTAQELSLAFSSPPLSSLYSSPRQQHQHQHQNSFSNVALLVRHHEQSSAFFLSRTRLSLQTADSLDNNPADQKIQRTRQTLPLLTREETNELLVQAVELRRIRALERTITGGTLNATATTAVDTRLDTTLVFDKRRKQRSAPISSQRSTTVVQQSLLKQLQLCQQAGYGEKLEELQDALEIGQRARETLVTRNMGLVHAVVHDIVGHPRGDTSNTNAPSHHHHRSTRSLSRDDLLQEGALGLARAVDHWNPAIGGIFSSYAYYYIRGAILRAIASQDDLVRIPEYVRSTVKKVSRAEKNLGLVVNDDDDDNNNNDRDDDTVVALAQETGLTERQVKRAIEVRHQRRKGIISFEAWMQQGRNMQVDSLSSPALLDTEHSAQTTLETDGHLKDRLSPFLRPKEMEALSLRYGLVGTDDDDDDNASHEQTFVLSNNPTAKSLVAKNMSNKGRWGEAMSFAEVGKKMQVSAEYGRRLCHAALTKLRQAAEEGTLELAILLS